MKAIVFEQYGGPEVLHMVDQDLPQAGQGQVRIKVYAVGVNAVEAKIRSGAMQQLWQLDFPSRPGTDVAGVVDQVGPGVQGITAGDEVLGWAVGGSYAEYALSNRVAHKPPALGWDVAASLPVVGEAALRVLTTLGVKSGETLVIHGGAGGVGTIAIQLAAREGVTVIATGSADNQEYLRSLGAIPTLYGDGLVDRVRALAPHGVDAVFDAAGKGALPDSIALRGGTDRIVTLADMAAQHYGVQFSMGTEATQTAASIASLIQLVADGAIRITVSSTFPLAQAAEAHRLIEAGHVRGKIVLEVV